MQQNIADSSRESFVSITQQSQRSCSPAGMGKRGHLPPPLEMLWSVFVH